MAETHVGHFSWSALVCLNCGAMVEKENWWLSNSDAAEQSVHPTGGTVPPLVEFLANPENYPTAEQGSRPTTSG